MEIKGAVMMHPSGAVGGGIAVDAEGKHSRELVRREENLERYMV